MIGRGPEGWDQRHRERGPDPGAPEPALVDTLGPLPAGRAVDLGSGAGRHALWLAARGWDVTAVDFSAVGAERGRAAAARLGLAVAWVVADARDWVPAVLPVDLVLTARVKLPTTVLQAAGGWLAPGGHLVVLGHAAVVPGRAAAVVPGRAAAVVPGRTAGVVPGRTSAGEPADGPRDPALRHTPDGLLEAAAGLVVERLAHVPRDGRPGALDLLLVARRDAPPAVR